MPNLVLSYSANLSALPGIGVLFAALHSSLAEVTGLKLDFFKSRAVCCEEFRIGDGAAEHAFVHLDIQMFPGRPIELRRAITDAAILVLRDGLRLPEDMTVQMTVDLGDFDHETYRKVIGGHAS